MSLIDEFARGAPPRRGQTFDDVLDIYRRTGAVNRESDLIVRTEHTATMMDLHIVRTCSVCKQHYREAENVACWKCARHYLSYDYERNRWRCCNMMDYAAPGCMRCDHTDRYDTSHVLVRIPRFLQMMLCKPVPEAAVVALDVRKYGIVSVTLLVSPEDLRYDDNYNSYMNSVSALYARGDYAGAEEIASALRCKEY